MGYNPRGHKESDMTEWLTHTYITKQKETYGEQLVITSGDRKWGRGKIAIGDLGVQTTRYQIYNLCGYIV